MTEPESSAARSPAEDARVREEWRKLERQRLDEEIAEAREDAQAAAAQARRRSGWLMWVAFAVALAAGIAVAVVLNWPGAAVR